MPSLSTTKFREYMNELQIILSEEQYAQFMRYYKLLTEWNSFMNLTAITDFEEVILKHFTDSLSIVRVCPQLMLTDSELSLIDVGTGAGFPGIPIKIAFPHIHVTLLDSLNKRVRFLEEVIGQLTLSKITAIHARAEDAARDGQLRERFDLCTSRAVAALPVLSEYCLPFVKKGGCAIAYKSEKTQEEIEASASALKILGGEVAAQEAFYLPGSDIYRSLIVIKKTVPTPKKYPRKAGTAAKEPL